MRQLYILLPFVQFTICLVLISVVILSAPRDRLNRLFTLFLVAMGLWGITIFWMRDAYSLYGTDPAEAMARAYAVEKVVFAARCHWITRLIGLDKPCPPLGSDHNIL